MLIKMPIYNEIEEFLKSNDSYCVLNHVTYKDDSNIICSTLLKTSTDDGQIILYSKPTGGNKNVTFKSLDSSFVNLKISCVVDNKFNIVFKPSGKEQPPDILKDSVYENYTLVVGPPGQLIKDKINLLISDLVNSNKDKLYSEFPDKKNYIAGVKEAVKIIKDMGFVTNLKYEYTSGLDYALNQYNNDIDFILSTLEDEKILFKLADDIYEEIKPSSVYWLSRADSLNEIIRDMIENGRDYIEEYAEIEKHYKIKSAIDCFEKAKTFIVITKTGQEFKVLSNLQNNINSGSCFKVFNTSSEINILDIDKILYKNKIIYDFSATSSNP